MLILLVSGLVANYIYRLPKFDQGEVAPDFEAKLMDGRQIKLSDYQGQFVLLDFWGSWCGPCRKENLHLKELHDQLNGQNIGSHGELVILSVGIEKKEENWRRAIAEDGLVWDTHIVQLDKFSSPIAQLYGVRQIPTTYLIDPSGTIIMRNASMEEVAAFLKTQKLSS